MKLAVLGATGRTGIPLIQQALDKGHEIKALARNKEKLKRFQGKISIVTGDATDFQSINETIKGTDAVIDVLGHARNSPKNILEKSTQHIISSMQSNGVKRIVILTGAGVRIPGDEPKFFDRFIVTLLKLLQGNLLKDSKACVSLIQNSSLDWTVARAPMLTEKPGDGTYQVGMVGKNTGPKLSRQNASTYLLDAIEKDLNMHEAPMISD